MLPEGYDGCFELMETVTNHLIARYPLLFTVLKMAIMKKVKLVMVKSFVMKSRKKY